MSPAFGGGIKVVPRKKSALENKRLFFGAGFYLPGNQNSGAGKMTFGLFGFALASRTLRARLMEQIASQQGEVVWEVGLGQRRRLLWEIMRYCPHTIVCRPDHRRYLNVWYWRLWFWIFRIQAVDADAFIGT